MTIRKKLNILILMGVVSVLVAMGVYSAIMAQVGVIQREREIVLAYRQACSTTRAEIEHILFNVFVDQEKTIKDAYGELQRQYAQIEKLEPSLSGESRQQAEVIVNLQKLCEKRFGDFQQELEKARPIFTRLFIAESGINLQRVITEPGLLRIGKPGDAELARQELKEIISKIGIVDFNLLSMVQSSDAMLDLMSAELQTVQQQSTIIACIVAFLLLVMVLFIANRISRGVATSISRIGLNVDSLKDGDLTRAFAEAGDEEILKLSRNMNTFLVALQASLEGIKDASAQTVSVKQRLVGAVAETAQSYGTIDAGITEVTAGVETLNQNILEASSAVEQIAKNITSLNERQDDEAAMVTESAAAVTEMIHSVTNVARVTRARRENTHALLDTSRQGGEKLDHTTGVIDKIVGHVDSVRGLTAAIQDISEQTNLLAMNAAIEAAHAGTVGKGFAVVAEEIRKLAGVTEANSKQIGSVISSIVEEIEEASTSSGTTREAFKAIETEIGEVARALDETASSMDELELAGKQILESMVHLQNTSAAVRTASSEMNTGAGHVSGAMEKITAFSRDVRATMDTVSNRVGEINKAMRSVQEIAVELDQVTDSLDGELQHFRTKTDGTARGHDVIAELETVDEPGTATAVAPPHPDQSAGS